MNSIRIETNKHTSVSYQEMILSVIASALCTLGCVFLLRDIFPDISGSTAVYVILALILTAVFSIFLWLGKDKWLTPAVSLGVLIIFIIRFRAVRNAMFVFANDILEFLTGKTGRIHLYFNTNGSSGTLLLPVLYLILISLLSAIMIRKKRLIFPLILLAIAAALTVYGFPVSAAALIMITAAAAISVAACLKNHSYNNLQSGSGRRSSGIISMLLPVIISLAAAALIFALVTAVRGTNSHESGRIAKSIENAAHRMRYEPSRSTGMPEGDLSKISNEPDPEKPMLKIRMSDPGKIYLRGFTGDIYEDSEWKNVSAETYIDNAPLFYTLHENGFYGQAMIASAADAVRKPRAGRDANAEDAFGEATDAPSLTGMDPDMASISVTPAGACRKYVYTPYGLYDTSILDPSMIGDSGCIARKNMKSAASSDISDKDSYAFITLPGSLPEWYETEIALAANYDDPDVSDYLKLESSYYKYVLENDLLLSDEAAEMCVELFGEAPVERTLSEILELVRNTMDCEEPVDYASSAALMLRYLGVPARYVEGYYLPPEEAASYKPKEEILLTGKHAHAWAEFYIRGIGWIPFETVPGYIDNDELSRVTTLIERSRETLGNSPLFAQAEVIYTSGIHRQEKPETREPLIDFKWKNIYFLYIVIAAVLILIAALAVILIRQHLHFKDSMSKIQRAKDDNDNNKAVAMEYSYALKLLDTAGIPHPSKEDAQKMQRMNELARFSAKKLPDTAVAEAEKFRKEAADACLENWSYIDRIRHRFIRKII